MPEARSVPDQAARDFIRERLDVNLLVEAGAGSGKTECLARRMAAGIVEGRYAVEEMAAVTFTRKAAAELRGRFQLTLEAALTAETDPARRERARIALGRLERLFAGTIHAFCAHLLRERPVEAGVAPGFTELDELADVAQRKAAWRDYLDRQRALGAPGLQALLDAGAAPRDLDDAFAIVCNYPEVDFPASDAPMPATEPARHALERFWAELSRIVPAQSPPGARCPLQLRAREFRGRLAVSDLESPWTLADLLRMWEARPYMRQMDWPGTPAQRRATKARVDTLLVNFQRDTVVPFLGAWRRYVYRVAMSLLLDGRGHAAQARQHAIALNYGDLLQLAAVLLRDRPDVREALQRKYCWLFVDEFQDTDPIQAEVILLLAAVPGAGRDWTEVPLRPGALFIVGDPKQSIYRFRRADIDTYLRVRERIRATGGEVAELTASFRAAPQLCDWANTVFRTLLPAEPTPQQPAFHALAPVRAGAGRGLAGVRTITVPDSVKGADEAARVDAEAIARFIRGEVDAGRRSPGDFLVLTRIRRAIPLYARALEAERLPVEVSGGAAFAQAAAVTSLAGLLAALVDPDDGPAVVGALRGPLFGVSDPELYRHRQAGHGFLLTAPGLEEIPGRVGEALRALNEMHRWTRSLPAPAAVERILEATGLLAMAAATSPGGAEAGDLLHAVDRVRQVAEEGETLADAAAALVEDLGSAEVESVPLEPGRSDVVRVMNLHKAKGLEAPVVFLADPRRWNPRRANVRIARDGLRATGYFRLTRPFGRGRVVLAEPEGWGKHEQDELDYLDAEQLCLLYVATTRARDLLVVSRSGDGSRGWGTLDPFLTSAPALRLPGARPATASPPADLSHAARAAARAAREARGQVLVEPSWTVASVTATTHRAQPYGQPLQEGRTREPDTGMVWGSLIHFLLEHAMRGPARDRVHLERLANWFAFEKPELRRVIPEALDTVDAVMQSDFWRQAMAAEERHVEAPFAVAVAAGAAPPQILHGVIDLAFRTADGWHLIDYKTDQAPPAALPAMYGEQAAAYATHWASLAGAPVAGLGLYAVRSQQFLALPSPAPSRSR
jgi:ATP-dependent helicase/nuclease subunit A